MVYACTLTHSKPERSSHMRQPDRRSVAPLNPNPKWPEGYVAVLREVGEQFRGIALAPRPEDRVGATPLATSLTSLETETGVHETVDRSRNSDNMPFKKPDTRLSASENHLHKLFVSYHAAGETHKNILRHAVLQKTMVSCKGRRLEWRLVKDTIDPTHPALWAPLRGGDSP